MGFGYIGYIWTLCGCSALALVVMGGVGFLYWWSGRDRRSVPQSKVEAVAIDRGDSDGGTAA